MPERGVGIRLRPQILTSPRDVVADFLRFIASGKNATAVLFFVVFILLNTLKIAVFDHLIVTNGAFPQIAQLLPGLFWKFILVNICFAVLMRIRWRFPIIFFYGIQTLYILGNIIYYFAFQGYLHASQYAGLFSEAFELVGHGTLPWDDRSFLVLADLPFLVGALFFYPRLHALYRRFAFKPIIYGSGVACLFFLHGWKFPAESPLATMNNRFSSDIAVVENYGLLMFNFMDLLNIKDDRSLISNIHYGPEQKAPVVVMPHPNIIMIQVESLDANIINYRYNNYYVTPFLHRLSNECLFYPYLMSYHLAGATSDCEFSSLNSIEAFETYPSIKIRNYDYPNSLIKRFTGNGYTVLAFHGNRGYYFNRNVAYKKMGFQKLYDLSAMHLAEKGWGAPDDAVFDFVLSRLKEQSSPFLYYIVTMSSHEPFTLVDGYYHTPLFNAIKDGAARHYLTAISYVDAVLQTFITKALECAPNTYVVIYGDHTPTMPKCAYTKASIKIDGRLFEFVPLFIIAPDRRVYREKQFAASFLDIAPTVFAAGGCEGSIRSLGRNLLRPSTNPGDIPFCRGIYNRSLLFNKISGKK